MSACFIDTNVWARYFLEDVPLQFEAARKLILESEAGLHRPYTSSLVFLEFYFVMTKIYKVPQSEVVRMIEKIGAMRGMTVVEKTDFFQALLLHKKTGVKLADCLIAGQVPDGALLVTFDKDFRRIPTVHVHVPG